MNFTGSNSEKHLLKKYSEKHARIENSRKKVLLILWTIKCNLENYKKNSQSVSRCGRVATVGRNVQKNSISIHIWEAVKLMGDGCFLLEDALLIQSPIVALDWLSLGDRKSTRLNSSHRR